MPAQPRHAAYAAAGELERGGPWGPGRQAEAADAVAWALAVGRSVGLELVVSRPTARPGTPVAAPSWRSPTALSSATPASCTPRSPRRSSYPPVRSPESSTSTSSSPPPASRWRRALSTYPLAHTDVALVVDETVPAAAVEAALREGAGESLESVVLFDVYRGEQVGAGRSRSPTA